MTKTLTEQYSPAREEILNALGAISEPEYNKMWRSLDEKTKDINELVQKMHILEKQLAIATKALEGIAFEIGDLESDYGYHYELAKKALKEMEGVK